MSRLAWVELDGTAPEHNLGQVRGQGAPGVLTCAVLKSNAYGHGVAQMASLLPSADWFGVNSLEEGLELRGLGVTRPVLLLGHVPLCELRTAVEADLRLTLSNRESIEKLAAFGTLPRPAPVHLEVDTGTSRQGILPEDLEDLLDLTRRTPNVKIEGLSTHYANIENTLDHRYAEMQRERFAGALATAERRTGTLPLVHTGCTAAALLFPETHDTMLRVGIGLYGLWPSRETLLSARERGTQVPDLHPVLSWKTRIAQLTFLEEGSCVGPGCTYRTRRRTLLGMLPVGYADGYDRALGNTAHVLVRGRRAPLVGRIGMNLCTADLTDVPGVALEDEVVLLGSSGRERISAEMVAEWAGTINYEIVTRISPSLPRIVDANRSGGQ